MVKQRLKSKTTIEINNQIKALLIEAEATHTWISSAQIVTVTGADPTSISKKMSRLMADCPQIVRRRKPGAVGRSYEFIWDSSLAPYDPMPGKLAPKGNGLEPGQELPNLYPYLDGKDPDQDVDANMMVDQTDPLSEGTAALTIPFETEPGAVAVNGSGYEHPLDTPITQDPWPILDLSGDGPELPPEVEARMEELVNERPLFENTSTGDLFEGVGSYQVVRGEDGRLYLLVPLALPGL